MEESEIVKFGQAYANLHGYISLGICLLSIAANAANVIVLTRRKMWSPSNLLLTAIAFTDILKMTSYCAFAIRFNIVSSVSDGQPLGWIVFLIAHTHCVLVLHAITTWLTVSLAIFRYFIICTKQGSHRVTIRHAKLTILVASCCSVLMYVPQYVAVGIGPWIAPAPSSHDALTSSDSELNSASNDSNLNASLFQTLNGSKNDGDEASVVRNSPVAPTTEPARLYTHSVENEVLYDLSHIIHGPVLKLLASVLITFPTIAVVAEMRRAAKRRENLLYHSISKNQTASNDEELDKETCISNSNSKITFNNQTQALLQGCESTKSNLPLKSSRETSCRSLTSPTNGKGETGKNARPRSSMRMERHHRTTVMLLAVVISFLVAELPQGVLLLIGYFSPYIQEVVYYRLSDLLDLIVLLYSAINFVLYCSMSQQFRTVFKETFISPVQRCVTYHLKSPC